MTPSDLERHPLLPVEKEDVSPQKLKARRRILPCLTAALLLLLSTVRIASGWCPAAVPPFTNFGACRVGQPHPGPASRAINSRAPTSTASAVAPTGTVLKTFEVSQPILMPDGPAESDGSTRHGKDYSPELCSVLLMRHDFAWSYDAPFVGSYTPPSCEFNRVVLNFSVVSQGRQYDRLALMYFGDTEVWRTSTAEPTAPPGISWVYLKDMTHYMSFWKSPQKVIFDLGNLVNDRYTGIFNTTMTAIFYNSDVVTDQGPPSDLIIPISARRAANNSASHFTLPAQNATNTVSLPRNARRAVFSISANGQASEEFWWSNVAQRDIYTFNDTVGPLPGYGPFREVQVLIDGQLAGVQWPYPVIFTGGVVPSLHRPIVGINAFDLREHEIDITPFLPLLCDGAQHTFTIRVVNLNNTSEIDLVNESWYVTGKIFVWLDDDPVSITRGDPPTVHEVGGFIADGSSHDYFPNGTYMTLRPELYIWGRHVEVTTPRLITQRTSAPASWKQTLSYGNKGEITNHGFNQTNNLTITGEDESVSSSLTPDARYFFRYNYTLFADQSYFVSEQGNLSIWAILKQGKYLATSGPSVFPSGLEAFSNAQQQPGDGGGGMAIKGQGPRRVARLDTTKEGTAEFKQSGDGKVSTGWGRSRQVFWFGVHDEGEEEGEELYSRDVEAVNGSVVYDHKRMAGKVVVLDGGGEGRGQVEIGVGAGDGVMVFAQVPVRDGQGRGRRLGLAGGKKGLREWL